MNTSSNPKRDQILKTGKVLFWKYGFKRVTIEEICREAGVSKMTFYKYFPNKIRLAIIILDRIFDESISKIRRIGDEHKTAEKTLEKIMQLKFEGTHGISEEFIKDLYAFPEGELQDYIQQKTTRMFSEVIDLYEKGKQDGWVRKDLNVPFMILFTRKTIETITMDDFNHLFPTSQEMIMELTRLFIYGIVPHT